jgi:glycosyltransferase involved in cell wall biosynthesis
MRFLMLNWRDPRNPKAGGAERVTQEYLAALVRRGHEATWFAFDFPGAPAEEIIDGVRILRSGGAGNAWLHARKWCRAQPPFDLVMDQHHGIPWYAPWWCRTNCVGYIHEVLGPIWDAFYGWPTNEIGKFQERWTHWFYRRVPFFTASSATKATLHQHGVKEVQIIPYGVHTRALPVLEPKPLKPPYQLIVVSRLAPNKRIDHAIRTLKALVGRGVDAQLTVVGTGEIEGVLRALPLQLNLAGRVRFTGPLPEPDKDALLRQSHFLLHTSQREGWGLNVIEANAMGTPAAVYPVAGLVESTLNNVTGIVSEEENAAFLAKRLEEAFAQPEDYQRWRIAAWERAKTFHWDNVLPLACDWLEAQARKRPL